MRRSPENRSDQGQKRVLAQDRFARKLQTDDQERPGEHLVKRLLADPSDCALPHKNADNGGNGEIGARFDAAQVDLPVDPIGDKFRGIQDRENIVVVPAKVTRSSRMGCTSV